MAFTKFIVLVDQAVDVRDLTGVLAELSAQVAAERDLLSFDGPANAADGANTLGDLSRRVAIDATTKGSPRMGANRPPAASMDEETRKLVAARWAEYGLAQVNVRPGPP